MEQLKVVEIDSYHKGILAWHFIGDSKQLLDGNTVEPGYTYSVDPKKLSVCRYGLHACSTALDAQLASVSSGKEVEDYNCTRIPNHRKRGTYACRVSLSGTVIQYSTKYVASERTVLWMTPIEPVWLTIYNMLISMYEIIALGLFDPTLMYRKLPKRFTRSYSSHSRYKLLQEMWKSNCDLESARSISHKIASLEDMRNTSCTCRASTLVAFIYSIVRATHDRDQHKEVVLAHDKAKKISTELFESLVVAQQPPGFKL